MTQPLVSTKVRPYKRSAILLFAYGVFIAALVNLVLGAPVVWTATAAGLAVVLAVIEIIRQVKRRGASA